MTHDEGGRRRPTWLRWGLVALRFVLFGGLIVWFLTTADLEVFAKAFTSIPPVAFLPAFVLQVIVITVGGVRYRVLMSAFASSGLPTWRETIRLYFVSLFYNVYVPGSFGGDVIRGVVTRRFFETSGASYVVVALERAIGFSAMGFVFGVGLVIGPDILDFSQSLPLLGALLGLGLVVGVLALANGKLTERWRRVPKIERPGRLFWIFGLSLISHMAGVTVAWVLARSMGLPLTYPALVLVMPVGFMAAVIPLNVLGVGTREVTLVALLGLLGLETERAVALSAGYALVHLAVSLIGGVIQLVQGRVGVSKGNEGRRAEPRAPQIVE